MAGNMILNDKYPTISYNYYNNKAFIHLGGAVTTLIFNNLNQFAKDCYNLNFNMYNFYRYTLNNGLVIQPANFSYVTNMSYAFANCYNIYGDAHDMGAINNVVNMSNAFYRCRNLHTYIRDYGNVTNMSYAFYNTQGYYIYMEGFKNVVDMSHAFDYCSDFRSCTYLYFSNLPYVENMEECFARMNNLYIGYDGGSYHADFYNIKTISGMFMGTNNIYLEREQYLFFGPNLATMNNVFTGCNGNLSRGLNILLDSNNITDVNSMFAINNLKGYINIHCHGKFIRGTFNASGTDTTTRTFGGAAVNMISTPTIGLSFTFNQNTKGNRLIYSNNGLYINILGGQTF